jgi:hypothetical protein
MIYHALAEPSPPIERLAGPPQYRRAALVACPQSAKPQGILPKPMPSPYDPNGPGLHVSNRITHAAQAKSTLFRLSVLWSDGLLAFRDLMVRWVRTGGAEIRLRQPLSDLTADSSPWST